jgi:hypothetical protein
LHGNRSSTPILFHGPHISKPNLFTPLSHDLALETNGNCDGDFFGAERSIVESGGEQQSSTRLWLHSAAAALSVATALSATATVLAVGFFV